MVKATKWLTNWFTHTLQQSTSRVHSTTVSIHQFDKENKGYYNTLQSSSNQLHHKSSRINTWFGYQKFSGKAAYTKQGRHIFVENNVLVPLENHNYVIFHEPTKCCFRYSHQTMQLSQFRCNECNWSVRYLLCQDVIVIKWRVLMQTSNYLNRQKMKYTCTYSDTQGHKTKCKC